MSVQLGFFHSLLPLPHAFGRRELTVVSQRYVSSVQWQPESENTVNLVPGGRIWSSLGSCPPSHLVSWWGHLIKLDLSEVWEVRLEWSEMSLIASWLAWLNFLVLLPCSSPGWNSSLLLEPVGEKRRRGKGEVGEAEGLWVAFWACWPCLWQYGGSSQTG